MIGIILRVSSQKETPLQLRVKARSLLFLAFLLSFFFAEVYHFKSILLIDRFNE